MVDDRLILRGADGYDEARFVRVFNARRPERYPAAVLVAESEDDVVEGVRLARDHGWKVAIRAGGHSFPAWSLRDDGLVIDLGGFKETTFDESTGVVSVTPSVSGGELNAYLSGYGRFFTTGDCPSLGLGGFLLQGGVGMGFRGCGYAAEQIASIDVVTADGELVTADEQSNSDLFWAARGAGPGFCGAITRFHLRTRPVPKGLAATTHIYPLARYAEVVEWVWKIHPSLSPDVALVAVSVIPPFPVPGADEGFMFVVAGVALSASRDDALKVLAPFAESPFLDDALVVQHAQPTTIAERLEFAGAITEPPFIILTPTQRVPLKLSFTTLVLSSSVRFGLDKAGRRKARAATALRQWQTSEPGLDLYCSNLSQFAIPPVRKNPAGQVRLVSLLG